MRLKNGTYRSGDGFRQKLNVLHQSIGFSDIICYLYCIQVLSTITLSFGIGYVMHGYAVIGYVMTGYVVIGYKVAFHRFIFSVGSLSFFNSLI